MNLITSIPALIAKISNLVERSVSSNIEVYQEALFPLPPVPEAFRGRDYSTVNPINTSSSEPENGTIAQSTLQSASFVNSGNFARGLWRLSFNINVRTDFARDSALFALALTPQTGLDNTRLIWMNMARGVNVLDQFDMWVSLDDDLHHVQIIPPSTGVAETVGYSLIVRAEKYL